MNMCVVCIKFILNILKAILQSLRSKFQVVLGLGDKLLNKLRKINKNFFAQLA